MLYWQWDPSLNIGIDVIDNQHKRIVDYINDLELAVRNKDQEVVKAVVEKMVDYTVTHFAFEEALMEKSGYKITASHQEVHRAFTRRIQDYQKRCIAGEDVARRLLSDLRMWLINHIKRDDKDYVPAVQAAMDESWLSKSLRKFFG